MLGGLLILSLSFLAASAETGKHWALIVAGSNGWYNYRHQVIIRIGKQTSYELQGPSYYFGQRTNAQITIRVGRFSVSPGMMQVTANLSTYFMPHTHKMKVTRHEACGHFRFWTEDIWEWGCKGNCITTDCLRDILFFSFPLFSFIGRTACVTRFSVRC